MYEGLTRLLIVFLTHPGVLVPIPAPRLWSWIRGLWQAGWVLVMNTFSEGKNKTTASIVYWMLLFLKIYVQVQLLLMGR